MHVLGRGTVAVMLCAMVLLELLLLWVRCGPEVESVAVWASQYIATPLH